VRETGLADIHLNNVPKELKTRWVKISQREGKTLTDWIIGRVENNLDAKLVQKVFHNP
jgi:hypothetical protein